MNQKQAMIPSEMPQLARRSDTNIIIITKHNPKA
jgi:hypothetical protein